MILTWESVTGLLAVILALVGGGAAFVHLTVGRAITAFEVRIMNQLSSGFVTRTGCDAAHLVNQIKIENEEKRIDRVEAHIERMQGEMLIVVSELRAVVRDNAQALRALTAIIEKELEESEE